jgi:plasmid segregation protein ParM
MQVLGVDIGFGFTKATDGRQHLVFKSVVGEATEIQFSESLLAAPVMAAQHIVLGGDAYFIGELAEQQSRGRGFTLDQAQFVAKYAKTLALAAIAPLTDSENVRLVTGLPISYYRKHKDALAALLQQRHVVKLVRPNGEAVEKAVNVERVRVIPQPFGSMFQLMLNDIGKATSQRFISEKIGIIDVGFRTADYSISDKTRYLERGSQSSEAGISLAFAGIANALMEKSGVQVELYRLYDAVTRGTIKIKGKRYDLSKIVQHAFQSLASRIAAEVNRLWSDDWDIDAIVLTGGGGAVLAPYLTPLLEGEVLPVPGDSDARLNNVIGYWKYGMHLWPE